MGTRWNHLDEAVLTDAHNLCFGRRYEKYQKFYQKNCHFSGGQIFGVFE